MRHDGDPITDRLLEQIDSETGACSRLPTYSYWRVYRCGDRLEKHRDRPACQISLTLSIDYDGDQPWPILVENAEGEHAVEIPRGCGLMYKGTEIPHWREACEPAWVIQVFLHYVDRDGPFRDQKFDGREALGLPAVLQLAQA